MMTTKKEKVNEDRYTEAELMARLKVFIGGILGLTLFGIVFVVLYSLIFVTQPLNAISPIDTKFFELIIPIATFLTGTLSGIMLAGNDKEARAEALKAANAGWDKVPTSPTPSVGDSGFSASGSFAGQDFSFGSKPSATPSAFGAAPTAASAMALAPTMSVSGKPMPVQPDQPEL